MLARVIESPRVSPVPSWMSRPCPYAPRGPPRLARQFLKALEAFLKNREGLPMLSLRLVDGPDLGQGPAGPWSIPPRFTSIQFCQEGGKAHLSLPRRPR